MVTFVFKDASGKIVDTGCPQPGISVSGKEDALDKVGLDWWLMPENSPGYQFTTVVVEGMPEGSVEFTRKEVIDRTMAVGS